MECLIICLVLPLQSNVVRPDGDVPGHDYFS